MQVQSPGEPATHTDFQDGLLPDEILRFLYLIIGAGTLFAYNAFMSCTDYYNSINPTSENVSGQMATYQLTAMFIVTVALLPFSTNTFAMKDDHVIVMNTDSSTIKSRVCNVKHFFWRYFDLYQPENRVLYGFGFTFLFLLVYLLLPPSAMTGPTLNLFSTCVGIADALSQSGLYVLAASYGKPTLTAAATLGGALSGFFASLTRLATRGMFDTESEVGLRKGADLLIGVAFGFTIVLIGSIVAVQRDLEKRREVESASAESSSHAPDENEIAQSPFVNTLGRNPISRLRAFRDIYSSAFLLTWKPIASAFLNFFFTLALFPGVTLDIPSTNGTFSLGNWLPVVLIAIFNGGDCAGRYILGSESMTLYRLLLARNADTNPQGLTQIVNSVGNSQTSLQNQGHRTLKYYNKLVWWPTFARIIFFPIISICILPTNDPIISSDILRCILIFVFGVSNGFIQCANFTIGPTVVCSEDAKNAVSMLLLLAIYSGLCLGAFFGLIVEKMIRNFEK